MEDAPAPVELCLAMAQEYALPNFKGLSMREVLNTARLLGIPVEVEGSGFVVRQSPPPGVDLSQVQRLVVELSPPNTRTGG
jgi:hypothetical protein